MNNDSVLDRLGKIGLIPTAVLDSPRHAFPLAEALRKGGIDTVEVTLRTEAAIEGISLIKRACPDFLVGAGTVLCPKQAEDAVKAGADYIVSPGFDAGLVKWCQSKNIPVIPGCSTASEIQSALSLGLTVLKFFPASVSGGAEACESLAGPFPMVKFVPTGGVGPESLKEYVNCGCVHAIGGGWLCGSSDIASEDWKEITASAADSVKKLLGFEVVHVGINTESKAEGKKISYALSGIFGFPVREGELSNFVGTGFEVNNFNGLGTKGHVAVDTNSIPRAEYHLGRIGVKFREDSRVIVGNRTVALYLQEEFGGFAIHIRQR